MREEVVKALNRLQEINKIELAETGDEKNPTFTINNWLMLDCDSKTGVIYIRKKMEYAALLVMTLYVSKITKLDEILTLILIGRNFL